MQEELDMYIADKFVNTKGNLDIATIDATTKEDVAKIMPSIKGSKYEEYVTIVDGKIVVSDEMPEEQREWANEAINGVGNVTPEEKTPVIQAGIEVTTANSSITGGKFLSTNPVIPVGFKTKATDDASWTDSDNDGIVDGWNDGLVIEDVSGNEFVWVPCTTDENDTSKIQYTKNFTYPSDYGATTENTSDDTDALPMKNKTESIDETDQITAYGGFYVGRYEAGVPANQTTIDGASSSSNTPGKPVVQPGETVWTYIDYTNANANAKSFMDTENVKSGLITGTAWDTICAWIQSETDSEKNVIHDVTNSTSWGNYYNDPVDGNNGKQVTGFKEEWKAKNIYDFAGNTWELTGESYDSSLRVRRGGFCNNLGSDYPASYRLDYIPSNPNVYVSFRLLLYVM